METVFLIPDTNTFLHYVSLEQIDWNQLFPNQVVVIIICPLVLRELNKNKDAPRTSKLRDRAAAALRKIDTWSDLGSPTPLRPGVEVGFRIFDPSIDFPAYNLVREIADDHIIATLIELRTEASSESVVLLTKDIGLKLKAKALNFCVVSLLESALLPDEALPSEKKIKDLEAQVRELQNARPKLKLAFSGGSNKLSLGFQGVRQLSEAHIINRMADLRRKYPRMVDSGAMPAPSATQGSLYSMFNAASALTRIDPESIRKYNDRLEEFFGRHAEYFEELADFYAWESRTAALKIILLNDGSRPADDIDIFMHFPDGFELFRQGDYEQEPEAPVAPARPRSIAEEASAGFSLGHGIFENRFYEPNLASFQLPAGQRNVSAPQIKRTNSYDVEINVDRAKHGIEVALDVMYVTFDPMTEIRSFAIDYSLHASNLPSRVDGTLNVIV